MQTHNTLHTFSLLTNNTEVNINLITFETWCGERIKKKKKQIVWKT